MSRLTEGDKTLLAQLYYKNDQSVAAAIRKFGTSKNIKNKKDLPHPTTVKNIIDKFGAKGSVQNISNGRKCNEEARDLVKRLVSESNNGQLSVRKVATETGISKSLIHNIMKSEMKLYPYKITIGQVLTDIHKLKRVLFCQ